MPVPSASMTMLGRNLGGKRVLMMEDDFFISEFIVRELIRLGAEVVGPFSSVRDGLDEIERRNGLDGAVLDIKLQGEVVYPVADALRKLDIPFVFFTAYGRNVVPTPYRDAPFCDKMEDGSQIADALFADPLEGKRVSF